MRILPAVLGAILQRYELGGGAELKDVEGEVQLGGDLGDPSNGFTLTARDGKNVGKPGKLAASS